MALMAWHGMTADDVVKEFAPVHGNLTVVRVRAYHRAAAQRFQMPTAAVRHLLFDAYCALPGSPRARAKTLAEILANGWDITRGASR